ncbi:DUF4397 domain-containing protein [Chitinophaga pendula]|uniref:DUF4397 domain-containing protein n=1 Tax=Chitinophaga TaxID=79328 RepID=UPI000BB02D02|nr:MULTISPECIES: DUF4397 domain-containing protein [Chitinophaga]ASZ12753.1 hypothetical protein CK934_18225 [Chitinophaga sp. MD30]UCJ09627.1 DUF4397 domain-containing protein [Chitinophaga pendula]
MYYPTTLKILYSTLAISLLGFSACKKQEHPPLPDIPRSNIALINGAHNAPPLLLSVDGKKIITRGVGSGYHSGKSGSPYLLSNVVVDRELKITDDREKLLHSGRITLERDQYYTLVSYGEVKDYQLTPFLLRDTVPVLSGSKAGLRLLHLSPDMPPVQIWLTSGNSRVQVGGILTYVGRLEQQRVFAPFNTTNSGAYTLEVSTTEAVPRTLITLPNLILTNGKSYTLYIKGLVNGVGAAKLSAGVVSYN